MRKYGDDVEEKLYEIKFEEKFSFERKNRFSSAEQSGQQTDQQRGESLLVNRIRFAYCNPLHAAIPNIISTAFI